MRRQSAIDTHGDVRSAMARERNVECKDDFDSDDAESTEDNDGDGISDLMMDDATRQQFEELAREYVGSIAEEKKRLQNELQSLQFECIKLEETKKVH